MNASSTSPKITIGVVIPAFNEAENLNGVLATIQATDWLAQVVIVNDGSSDDTLQIVRACAERDMRVQVVDLPINRGKAGAMLAGVQTLQTDLVIFLDADLINLKPQHLMSLQTPVISDQCEMSIALFRHGRFRTALSHRLTPNLSGQRCMWREAAEHALGPIAGSRFGVEMGLTRYAHQHHWRIQRVYWTGVTHRMKEEKRKVFSGIAARWQMYCEIAGAMTR
jgi:hypothetical protein